MAVCDILPARIRALRSKGWDRQNVGGASRGPTGPGERNPGGPEIWSAYRPGMRNLGLKIGWNIKKDKFLEKTIDK
jgi:hypothetical protein